MQERNSKRNQLCFLFHSKMLTFLCLFAFLLMAFKQIESQKTYTRIETTFCYNSSLEGFRLSATVLEVRNVSSRIACIDECLEESCCRSINYEHISSPDQWNKCEFLHHLFENTSFALVANSSFDHVFVINPLKEYDPSCFPKEELSNKETMVERSYISCKDVFERNGSAPDGVYDLQSNETSEIYEAYCHMSNLSSQCGGGGWTLVMKLNPDKDTFEYNSALWTNNVTLNVDVGLNGLSQNEMKTASYHNTPFTKICLGMTRNNVTNWILVNYTARSLYSVIADGNYHATNVGGADWSSLLEGSLLDENCGKEGFNLPLPMVNARIGFAANNENNCDSHDSVIGFGITQKSHSKRVSSGNVHFASSLKAFGYILVQ